MSWICPDCRNNYGAALPTCPSDGATLVRDRTGQIIAFRYSLLEPMGFDPDGAEVWKAWQASSDREVAVTLVSDLTVDPVTLDELARAVTPLRHPHIASVYDIGALDNGEIFVATELMEGHGLDYALSDGVPLDPGRVARLAEQLLGALEFAHRRDVVHGDIRPAAVVLRTDGEDAYAKLAEFGLSVLRAQHRDAAALPIRRVRHLAPECLRGAPGSPHGDLFSLATVIHQMYTGAPPFDADGIERLLVAQHGPPPPLPAMAGGDHGPVADVLRRAMAADPDARYGSASTMRDALRSAAGRAPLDATPIPALMAVDGSPEANTAVFAPEFTPDFAPYGEEAATVVAPVIDPLAATGAGPALALDAIARAAARVAAARPPVDAAYTPAGEYEESTVVSQPPEFDELGPIPASPGPPIGSTVRPAFDFEDDDDFDDEPEPGTDVDIALADDSGITPGAATTPPTRRARTSGLIRTAGLLVVGTLIGLAIAWFLESTGVRDAPPNHATAMPVAKPATPMASVEVTSRPSGAEVRDPNGSLGHTPWRGELAVGVHALTLILEGHEIETLRIRVDHPGDRLQQHVSLRAMRGGP